MPKSNVKNIISNDTLPEINFIYIYTYIEARVIDLSTFYSYMSDHIMRRA